MKCRMERSNSEIPCGHAIRACKKHKVCCGVDIYASEKLEYRKMSRGEMMLRDVKQPNFKPTALSATDILLATEHHTTVQPTDDILWIEHRAMVGVRFRYLLVECTKINGLRKFSNNQKSRFLGIDVVSPNVNIEYVLQAFRSFADEG